MLVIGESDNLIYQLVSELPETVIAAYELSDGINGFFANYCEDGEYVAPDFDGPAKYVINERKVKNDFVDLLEIWHAETPAKELTREQAMKAAEAWCAENDSYSEGHAWQESLSADDPAADVWHIRVCPNNYQG